MGNFTLKTDSYLNQFELFRAINTLLGPDGYQDTKEDKIPSLPQLLADKMYHEWIDLAGLVAEIDNWTEQDWNNFNICMSLAESCKSRIDSISYALEGLGWNFTSENNNSIDYSGDNIVITINVDNIDTPPRIDEIKDKLKRCIEYLILVKDADLELNINKVNMTTELPSESLTNELVTSRLGIFIEAEISTITSSIVITIYDPNNHPVTEYESYWDPIDGYGYDKLRVVLTDSVTHDIITDPSLYEINAYYQAGNSDFRMSVIQLDETGWVYEEPGVGNDLEVGSYVRAIPDSIAEFDPGVPLKSLAAPVSSTYQLIVGETGTYLDHVADGNLYFRCLYRPQESYKMMVAIYTQQAYDTLVQKFNLTLNKNNWDPSSKTITIRDATIRNLGTEFIASDIPEGELLNYCNSHGIRIYMISRGVIVFKCSVLPNDDLTIPMVRINEINMETIVPINVSDANPIPSVYFDKDEMVIWVVRGAGPMDYSTINVVLKAKYVNGAELTIEELSVTWVNRRDE